MTKEIEIISEGLNYTAGNLGVLDQLMEYEVINPATKKGLPGKVFLGEVLKMTGLEVSLQIFPPGMGMPFTHKHRQNEEFYIILKGHGEFTIDNTVVPLCEGTVIRIAPNGARIWHNTGNEPMIVLCVQSAAGSLQQATTKDGILC